MGRPGVWDTWRPIIWLLLCRRFTWVELTSCYASVKSLINISLLSSRPASATGVIILDIAAIDSMVIFRLLLLCFLL